MPDVFDPWPPQPLRAFYARFSARYCAPGVCLRGYRLRWIAYRSDELDWGIERAVLDLVWGEDDVTRQSCFVERAREEAGARCRLTFVEVGLKRSQGAQPGSAPALASGVLGISMWRTDHPCGLTGRIELNAQGHPTGCVREPRPLMRMGG